MIVRKIHLWPAARISGLIYFVIGLLVGFLVFAVSLFDPGDAPGGVIGGAIALLVAPLFYMVVGAIGALFGAAVYNTAARLVGGIEVDTDLG